MNRVVGGYAVRPRTARLKEWAYAGIAFDRTGVAAWHLASGDDAGKVMAPLVLLALSVASWPLRPESRTLASPLG